MLRVRSRFVCSLCSCSLRSLPTAMAPAGASLLTNKTSKLSCLLLILTSFAVTHGALRHTLRCKLNPRLMITTVSNPAFVDTDLSSSDILFRMSRVWLVLKIKAWLQNLGTLKSWDRALAPLWLSSPFLGGGQESRMGVKLLLCIRVTGPPSSHKHKKKCHNINPYITFQNILQRSTV